MRSSKALQLYATLFLFLSAFTSAWPWPRFLPDIDSLIVRRQDGGDSKASDSTAQPSAKKTDTSSPSKQTGSSAAKSVTTAPSSKSGSASKGSTTNKPTITQHTSYDPRIPAGGVSMVTPGPLDGAQYYKILDYVTFAWNYTSLLATPSAVDIIASCSANEQVYTIAVNQTVTNATQAVTWDTSAYQSDNPSVPLLTEKYTLIIYDAASSVSEPAQAGYLAPFNQFTFGMYSKQDYHDLDNGFQCATCSGALSNLERNALGFTLSMCTITVLSFTWFLGGADIIW